MIYIGKNKKGQHQLSRKKFLEARNAGGPRNSRGGGGRRNDGPAQSGDKQSSPAMTKEEIEVIAKAIEGISEL